MLGALPLSPHLARLPTVTARPPPPPLPHALATLRPPPAPTTTPRSLSMSAFRVRDATITDVDTLVAFNAAMALETEGLTLDAATLAAGVAAVFAGDSDRGARYFVASPTTAPADIAAACMVTCEWSDWRNAPVWWLQSVYCAPQFRRRGAFGEIYTHVRTAAAAAGAAGVRLYAEEGNDAAAAVYERLGMKAGRYRVFEDLFYGGH